MEDPFGHLISYLRLSITDRCNERCHYCMPEELQTWLPRSDLLSYEEILRCVRAGVALGIHKLRVTGGEPLTRRDVIPFIAQLHAIPGIDDIGLSTNGTLLSDLQADGRSTAAHLRDAGVRTVNISLDTLDPAAYAAVTGRDLLPKVLAGIAACRAAGFAQIKLNCVLMKDRHQDPAALPSLLDFADQQGCLLRFIELMPVTSRELLEDRSFLPTATARRLIEARTGPLVPRPGFKTNGPASYYQVPGRDQLVGFIGAMTNLHFCESCNKLRLTSDGKLRPCLGSHLEFDLRAVLRAGADDAALKDFFLQVVARKPKEHDFRTTYQPGRHMTAIGG